MKKIKNSKIFAKRLVALIMFAVMLFYSVPLNVSATAYDPNSQAGALGLKFMTDKPELGFYINAGAKWELQHVPDLQFGTGAGEWTALNLLRGMYIGADYINDISADYFTNYIKVFENTVIGKAGNLDRNKSTEFSRLMLAMSSLGYDVNNIAPHYRVGGYNGTVVSAGTDGAVKYSYDFPLKLSSSTSYLYRQGINGPIWALTAMNSGGYKFYTSEQIQAGLDGTDSVMQDKLASFNITSIEAESRTVNATTGKITAVKGVATEGKLIEYIMSLQIVQTAGTYSGFKGGWALSGASPDPDITGMALQALAPYYLNEARFDNAMANAYYDSSIKPLYTYNDLKTAVENAIWIMSEFQKKNGGFSSWGTANCESSAQILVALTELGIDPMSKSINLPTINKTCSFIKAGETINGAFTNNIIDNILSYWDSTSGTTADVGGFKHVTSGSAVNAMATDQALLALVSYQRFSDGQKSLYNMADMTGGQYKTMSAKNCTLTLNMGGKTANQTKSFSPYETITAPSINNTDAYIFNGWNTKADGSGISISAGDTVSMPSDNTTLYAMWTSKNNISEVEDKTTGVIVVIDPTVVPEGTTVDVKEINDKATEEYKKIENALQGTVNKFVAYQINLYSENVIVEPNGKIKVKLPVPDGYNSDRVKIIKILSDGTTKEYPCIIINGYAEFEADSFSIYTIVEGNITNVVNPPTGSSQTADKQLYYCAIFAVMSLAVLVIYRNNRKTAIKK